MKRVCILGAGAAGLLLLLQLEKNKIDLKTITVIDPTHTGGDLANKWPTVRSNTTWKQITDAVPSFKTIFRPWVTLKANEVVELKLVIDYLRECTKAAMQQVTLCKGLVRSVEYEGVWKLFLEGQEESLEFDVVFFCQGAEPKCFDTPFPTLTFPVIPLDVALDKQRLSENVKEGQHVLVFGLAHSGTLVLKNLLDLGVKATGFYNSCRPFFFESEGSYDGLKQESAVIAHNILDGIYPGVNLVTTDDISATIFACKSADACIYACGFQPRIINPEWKLYDGNTGRIQGTTTAWGFGIAYPNRAPDGIHWDVSIPAFQAHIEKQMPDILATLQ